MSGSRRSLGDFGERVARSHLEAKGYSIVSTNYRSAEAQVDVIAQKGDVLAFVEVKTRRGATMGTALEAIGGTQAARLLAASSAYDEAGSEDKVRRVDLVAIALDSRGRVVAVEHIENAVEPS